MGNIAIGESALKNATVSASDYSIAIGSKAMLNINGGVKSIAIGPNAMGASTASTFTIGIGDSALYNNGGTTLHNIGIGKSTLKLTTTGTSNVAVGGLALYNNVLGSNNTAIGDSSLYTFSGGAFGRNTAVGAKALSLTNNGLRNTAVGAGTLVTNVGGNKNTAIGANADVTAAGLDNTSAIGSGTLVSSSNTMAFGDANVTKWAFGLTTTSAPSHALEVGNGAGNGNGAFLTNGGVWTNASDRNKKENFSNLNGSVILRKIAALPITQWRYKGSSEYHIGPMAQDFKATFNLGTDDKSISTIDPAGIALLAIQQLIKENESLRKRIEALEEKK